MYKKYLLLDTGYYFLLTIELISDYEIELTTELLEQVAAAAIKNNLSIHYMIDDEEVDDFLIDDCLYLDLSAYDIDYNIYLFTYNLQFLDDIPKSYTINLQVEV